MMRLKILGILSAIFILSANVVLAQNDDTVVLQSLVKQMVDAQSAYDPARLEKLTTADYIEISPVGEFDPREKMLGFYKPELKPTNMEVKNEVDEFSVRNYGKFAVVIARLNYLVTMDGKPMPPRGIRATFVCRKEKGEWKIASVQYTGIRPPA